MCGAVVADLTVLHGEGCGRTHIDAAAVDSAVA